MAVASIELLVEANKRLDLLAPSEPKPLRNAGRCQVCQGQGQPLKNGVLENKKPSEINHLVCVLAEAVRFELTDGFHHRRFSRPVHSTTLPRFLHCNVAEWAPSSSVGLYANSELL